MISLETSLQHLAWSNEKFFTLFGDMPDEVFALRAAEGEWPVGQLLTHLAGSGQWYRYCLSGVEWSELKPITSAQVALEYLPIIADLDEVLLTNLAMPDDVLTFEDESGPSIAKRSLILSQAVMHAAEHKGQIATILKLHGYHISLDDLDVWNFIAEIQN